MHMYVGVGPQPPCPHKKSQGYNKGNMLTDIAKLVKKQDKVL